MATEIKSLFRPDAIRPKLAGFVLPSHVESASRKLADWSNLLGSKQAEGMKETELLADFVRDVFVDLLGYVPPPASPYTLRREALVKVDGKFADAAFGVFDSDRNAFAAVLEGKGPRDPLDRPFAGRKRSAVEQALQYAVQLQIDWYLVTNLKEIRLYHKGHDTFTYERFETARLAEDAAQRKRFVYLLGSERVLHPGGNHLDALLAESKKIGRELTDSYYREYRALRERTFEALKQHNPNEPPTALLAATQKMLDRVLFIAFCEDRGLLPRDIIARAYQHADPFNPRPIWDNFVGLFRAVDTGNERLNVTRYNGGLFARDPYLEGLTVPDAVCEGFHKLAEYEYGNDPDADARLIDVEILGHIFEQSISDLEEMQQGIDGRAQQTRAKEQKKTTRKEAGAFYTPAFITRYLVAETLGPIVADRFERLRAAREAAAPKTVKSVFADPAAFDVHQLTKSRRAALVDFWHDWIEELQTVRLVDPACGSGAFLIEAFDQMFAHYQKAQGFLTELRGPTLFDIRKTILEHNLYGVDLNGEAVEIARLSCWIKTAEVGKVLTSLDHNIRQGNSVVADSAVHPKAFDWHAAFPEAFAAGGFDVVVGNPPYVRQEWISPFKPYLQQHYRAYDGSADLYVYFYELGINLLRPGGRLGFVVTNKWMKAGYGEPLRRFFRDAAWVESVVDFGHAKQIFADADVFPSILVARRPNADPPPLAARVCAIAREQLRITDLSNQIAAEGFEVPRERLGADAWTLEPPGIVALLEKIRRAGVPLKEFAGSCPYRGILTGFNDAFLMDTATKERLIAADAKSASLFKPYLRGQDINRWRAEWNGLWMLALKSSGNHAWPWANAGDRAEAVFAATYPAIHAHLNQYRDALIKRQDQGEHWWELRSCAYWEKFDKPKVMYQEIQFHPCYLLDTEQMLANNKVFFLPGNDLYLLGVLNSPLMWWHNWRYLPHMKDEALTPAGFLMEGLPIASPTDELQEAVKAAVHQIIDLTGELQAGRQEVLDWLRVEFAVEKPSQKLLNVSALDADTLVAEVKKARGKQNTLTVAGLKALKDEHLRSIVPLQAQNAEARRLEAQVAELVNAAYGLTPDEVALMWRTTPPRMPVEPPTNRNPI
ncbi:MAG TPA: N-6 DNA methylase [Gemmataceae bacterium]|jgi:hypothetical protein